MIVLGLALLMIAWNLYSRPPGDVATIKPWEHLAAKAAHLALYTMMVALPITGYLVSTSAGEAISIFGWVHVPALIQVDEALRDFAIEVHFYLAYGTGGLVLIHMLAALKHQFIDRDGTLGRML
jgi:cytochrome b561